MGSGIDSRLPVVSRIEPATGALHDAAVGIGEVVLILVPRHAEGSLVAAALGLAVLAARLVVIAICAFNSATALSMWPQLIAWWRLALALTLMPSTAMVPSLTGPTSRARRTTCTNRSESSFKWKARKPRIARRCR